MGEVKNKNVAIGAAVVVSLVAVSYYRKKKNASATAQGTSTVDPNAIDPATGISYADEQGYSSGYYTNASIPNPYVNQASMAGTSTSLYTDNLSWLTGAEQIATNQFGATYALATSALGKYLNQSSVGLQADEYQLVSEVVAVIGQPPIGGPYRLIQAAPVQNPSGESGGGSTPTPEPPEPTPTPTPRPIDTNPPPAQPFPAPAPTPTPAPIDPNLHYTSNGTISLNTLAQWNSSTPQKIINATQPSEPSDVANYLRKGSYNAILPTGTKWNIPRN